MSDSDRGWQTRHKVYDAEDNVEILMLDHSTSEMVLLWTIVPVDEDVAIAMMEMMAIEAGIEAIAWTGMTRIVVLLSVVTKDDSNVNTDPILPKMQSLDLRGLIPNFHHFFLLVPSLHLFSSPSCFFHPLRSFQDRRTLLSTRLRTGVITAATTAVLLPDVFQGSSQPCPGSPVHTLQ